jgi:alkylation response protein AidB-like acyl-CoA dehydrogenase
VDFTPSDDQQALARATREFVESRFSDHQQAAAPDDLLWKELAGLGWLGLGVAEDAGGYGATLLDEAFVFTELGRGLVTGPVLTTLAAARLATWQGARDLAESLITGELKVARAVQAGDAILLADPEGSALALLVTDEVASLVSIPAATEMTTGIDDAALGRVGVAELTDTVVECRDVVTIAGLRRVLTVLTSAQLAGIASATADFATDHAKTRVQFGRAIGAFQSVKHACADMAIWAHAAIHAAYWAALTETDYDVLAAAAFCRRAAFNNTRVNVHLHGALGFTTESTAHRYLKRTHTLCATEGFDRSARKLSSCGAPTENP